MPINLRALVLLLAGIISSPLFAATDNSTEILLSGAQKWVDKDRADLAKPLLQKALLIEPNSPKALLMLGKIELKNGNPGAAQGYLKTLQQTAPASASTRELNDVLIHSNGNQASFKSMPVITEKSAAFVKPVVAQETNAKPPEKTTIIVATKSKVTKKYPKSLAKHAAKHTAEHKQIVVEESSAKPLDQPVIAEPPVLAAIDPDIIARSAALDALDDGKLEQAEAALSDIFKRRPHDDEVLGGLGRIKLSEGKPDDAEIFFSQALSESKEGDKTRWKSLLETASFWKYINTANKLLDTNQLHEAESAVQKALVLHPGDPNALALLGNINAASNNDVEAERLYREAISKEGYNVSAIRGLSTLLSRTQRSGEALELIDSTLQKYPEELKKDSGNLAALLRVEADMFVEAQQPSRAMNALENAVKIDPKNPWSRYSLARLYISLDLAPLGRQVMQEGIALDPKNPIMHYTRALVLLGLDDYAGGLNSLNQIPDDALTQEMRETRKLALIKYDFQQAEKMYVQGNRKEAIRIMSIAQTQVRGNYSATEQLAEGWFKLGQQKQGLSAMRKLPQPVPLETQVHFASLLNRAKMDQELADYLPSIHIPDGKNDTFKAYRATIQNVELAMAGRHFDSLNKAGKTEQAQEFADNILNAAQLSSSDYFKYHRSYFANAKLPEDAISRLNQEKEQNPDDLNIRWELAYAYYQDKQNSSAQREMQELIGLTKIDDVDMRLRIATLQQSLGNNSGALTTLDDLTGRFPNNTDVLLRAGNVAQSIGEYNRAMRYYGKIKDQSQNPAPQTAPIKVAEKQAAPRVLLNLLPASGMSGDYTESGRVTPLLVNTRESEQIYHTALRNDVSQVKNVSGSNVSSAEQAMDTIKATRSATIAVGLDIQSKPASSGTTTYNAIEVPVLARFPIGYQANGFIQVDQVNIDSGALPSSFADAALFGKIQAKQWVPPQPLTPTASGTSVAVGYEQGSVKVDIGKVGIGFPVSNMVGGIRQSGMIGRLSYSLNLSRRAYTGSQLSYAGEKDPNTGVIWGGVTNTGVSLYMSTTLPNSVMGVVNVAVIGTYGLLRGINVLNNDKLSLTGIVNQDIYTTDDMAVNLGLSLSYLSFSKNLSYFTFGQGGYYSPQSSLSFGIPLELSGRAEELTYQLKTSVTYSSNRTDTSPFYPTDPALQVVAGSGGALPTGYTQPVYSAGSGGGVGYSFLAATEYRATPSIVVGGRFSIDRSEYYAPNSAFFYLKYMFNAETSPIKLHPDPVIPYSQY